MYKVRQGLKTFILMFMVCNWFSSSNCMKIFVIYKGTGKKITLNVESNDTIATLQAKIQDQFGLKPSQQVLSYRGLDDDYPRGLDNKKTISENNIKDGSILVLNLWVPFS